MKIALWVALGSGLGGMCRLGLGAAALAMLGPHFPYGILAVNALGSWAIGFGAALTAPDGRLLVSAAHRQFFLTGFCGGFTTFSFFSVQTLELIEQGRFVATFFYATGTLALALVGVWLGNAFGRHLNTTRKPA